MNIKHHIIKMLHPDIRAVKNQNLTYLDEVAMLDLKKCVKGIDRKGIQGIFMEMGCALGGSSLLITQNKAQGRVFKMYDVFGLIPPPSDKDDPDVHERYATIQSGKSKGLGNDEYYGYKDDLIEQITSSFREAGFPPEQHHLELVQGLYEDTLKGFREQVAFAHIDCDWYESVLVCLEAIVPNLSVGGTLIIDDYHYWSGCTKAVDDYFKDQRDGFLFLKKSRLHIVKK